MLAVAAPASAHSCAVPATAEVGETTTLTIGVAAEDKPIVGVDVAIPDGFELTGPLEVPSWQAAKEGDTVHFTAGRVEPFGCGYVTLRGRAGRKGRLVFPLTVTAEDGTTRRYADTDAALPTSAGLLYAGVDPPDASGEDGGNGGPPTPVIIGVAAVLGAAGFSLLRWRRRLAAQTTARRAARAPGRRASGSSRPGKRKRRPPRRR